MLESFNFLMEFPAPPYPHRVATWATNFPKRAAGHYVYVICWVDNGQQVPFYVGESDMLNERMDAYCCKSFHSPRDFIVGEAICHLRDKRGFKIVVRYKESTQAEKDERITIRNLLLSGVRLLNSCLNYQWKQTNQQDEQDAVHGFCDVLTRAAQCSACAAAFDAAP